MISGVYGSQRILNGKARSPHLGIDFAAPKGTDIKSPADGYVTLAENGFYFTGGSIILDHGHGVSTIYAHLDEILVKKDELNNNPKYKNILFINNKNYIFKTNILVSLSEKKPYYNDNYSIFKYKKVLHYYINREFQYCPSFFLKSTYEVISSQTIHITTVNHIILIMMLLSFTFLLQKRQTFALSCISSAECGHFFIC